jgi:hypothetical protein
MSYAFGAAQAMNFPIWFPLLDETISALVRSSDPLSAMRAVRALLPVLIPALRETS